MILYLMNRMGLRYMDSTLLVVLRVVKTKGTFGEFFFLKNTCTFRTQRYSMEFIMCCAEAGFWNVFSKHCMAKGVTSSSLLF